MQADDAGNPPHEPDGPSKAGPSKPAPSKPDPSKAPSAWERIKSWDSEFSVAKGLAIVTLLTSVFGGYFQYLNAYQDKVSTQAKDDMAAATTTFMDISNAFSQVQALQQILYADFTEAIRDKSDTSQQSLTAKNAQDASLEYERERTALRESADVLARKAEIYIDWASDTGRDPAAKRNVNDDPLTRSLLRDYDFDCADNANFPQFGNVDAKETPADNVSDKDFCAAGRKQSAAAEITPADAFIRICPGKNDKTAVRIYWYSAKHHVLTMHYCLEAAHDRLEAARAWAARSDRDTTKESQIIADADRVSLELDNLTRRLNAFTSLALSQMERIRVKYRPGGVLCSLPFVRDLFTRCFPVRTAVNS
jgi:hypothetical protein